MPILRVRTQLGGSMIGPGLATHYFDGATSADATSAVAAVAAFWNAVKAKMVSYTTWSTLPDVAKIDEQNGDLEGVFPVAPVSGVGAEASTALPSATQGLLQLRTGVVLDGREIRGRLFIPGPCIPDEGAAIPTPVYTAAISAAGAALVAAAGPDWVVWRRPREARAATADLPALPQRDGAKATIITATCWAQWAVLRGRRD